eukprot:3348172-Prymnesium_polylepis.1
MQSPPNLSGVGRGARGAWCARWSGVRVPPRRGRRGLWLALARPARVKRASGPRAELLSGAGIPPAGLGHAFFTVKFASARVRTAIFAHALDAATASRYRARGEAVLVVTQRQACSRCMAT